MMITGSCLIIFNLLGVLSDLNRIDTHEDIHESLEPFLCESGRLQTRLTSWQPDCSVINKTICGLVRVNQTRKCEYFAKNDNTGICDWKTVTNQKKGEKLCRIYEDITLEQQVNCRQGEIVKPHHENCPNSRYDFCLNEGVCYFNVDDNNVNCTCVNTKDHYYLGERCEHKQLWFACMLDMSCDFKRSADPITTSVPTKRDREPGLLAHWLVQLAQRSKLSPWSPTCSSMETSFCSPVLIKPRRVCNYTARNEVSGECYTAETNDTDFAKALFCFSDDDDISMEKEEILCSFEDKTTLDNSADVEDHNAQMTQWQPGCEIYNMTFCGSLRFKQSRSCEFYARDGITGDCYRRKTTDQNLAKTLRCDPNATNGVIFEREVQCNSDSEDVMVVPNFESNITLNDFGYEKLDPFMSAWQPGCDSFRTKLCGKLRLNQTRACSFYERSKTTGDCSIKTTKDLQIAKELGCVSSSEFDNVFEREHVCNFDSTGSSDEVNKSNYESQLTSWHPDCSASLGDNCRHIPILQSRSCIFYERNGTNGQCVRTSTTNVKMSWHLNCPFEDGKAIFQQSTLCDPDAIAEPHIVGPWTPKCENFEGDNCGSLPIFQKRYCTYYERDVNGSCLTKKTSNTELAKSLSCQLDKDDETLEREKICSAEEQAKPHMGLWFPTCTEIHCGLKEYVIKQRRYCEYHERNPETGMCQTQKTNSLDLVQKLSCPLDTDGLIFQRDIVCHRLWSSDSTPSVLLGPWYPRDCRHGIQNRKYCGISTVTQNRQCVFHRWNETGEGECFVDRRSDDVALARKLSCFADDDYPFLQREIRCESDNIDQSPEQKAEEQFKAKMGDWFPSCGMIEKTHCGNWKVQQTRVCEYFERNETTKECVPKTTTDNELARLLNCTNGSSLNLFAREHFCRLYRCDVEAIFHETEPNDWPHETAHFEVVGQTAKGDTCYIGYLCNLEVKNETFLFANPLNLKKNGSRHHMYPLTVKCPPQVQMLKNETFAKIHIRPHLPNIEEAPTWKFIKLGVMVNRNWAIYEGAEVWKPTSLNPTTEIYPENKRSENVNNFASLTAREQTSNNVFSTYQDKISYCKGTMCEQNRRSFYVKIYKWVGGKRIWRCSGALVAEQWVLTPLICAEASTNKTKYEAEIRDFTNLHSTGFFTTITEEVKVPSTRDSRYQMFGLFKLENAAPPEEFSPIKLCDDPLHMPEKLRMIGIGFWESPVKYPEEPEYKPAHEHGLQEIDVREYGYQLGTDTEIFYAVTRPFYDPLAIRDPCFGENGSPMFSVDEEGRAICLFGLKNSLDYQCDIGLMEASYGEFDYYGGDIFALRVTFVDDWMRDYIKLRSDEV